LSSSWPHEVVGYRSLAYWRDFAILYWRADEATGLYKPRSVEEIAEAVERRGTCSEEYGVWGTTLISRREYDDGSVFRNGKLQSVDAQLQVRQLAAGAIVIVAQLSALNDVRNDVQRERLLKEHMAGRASLDVIIEWVERLPRHRRDSY
jgi:hypothetical protein